MEYNHNHSKITNATMSELYERTGAFFAFSKEQYNESAMPGIKYTNAGIGLICPIDNVGELISGFKAIFAKDIEMDLADNGIEGIIRYQLSNHECYYTNDITDVVERLEDYGITEEQIHSVFRAEQALHSDY